MTKYLIDFTNSASETEINAYLTENTCSVISIFHKLDRVYLVESPTEPATTPIVTSVINDDLSVVHLLNVIDITQLTVADSPSISVFDQKDWWKIYSLRDANLEATELTIGLHGAGVNVYLMDSGIKLDHADFVGVPIDLTYTFTGSFEDNTGHGTALASIIAGNTCGLTNSTVKVVKIFDSAKQTQQSDLLAAFDAILLDAGLSGNKVSVVNMSWTIARNEYIESKIRILSNAGIALVGAAGNSGLPITDVTPAGMDEVITVGSYGPNFIPSNFSNYADASTISYTPNSTNHGELNMWAPGENIWHAKLDGTYGYSSGTSASAAIHSAVIAYNAAQTLKEDGDLTLLNRNSDGTLTSRFKNLYFRSGLLDLSDPKYATSQNKISTYFNAPSAGDPNMFVEKTLAVPVGGRGERLLFVHHQTKSIEFLDPIPDWCVVQREWIISRPTQDPTTSDGIYYGVLRYRVTLLDDTTADNVVNIRVYKNTIDPTTLPPDHPLLIQLAFACDGVECSKSYCDMAGQSSDNCSARTGKYCYCNS